MDTVKSLLTDAAAQLKTAHEALATPNEITSALMHVNTAVVELTKKEEREAAEKQLAEAEAEKAAKAKKGS